MSVTARRATVDDFRAFYGRDAVYSASAWVGEHDGDIIAIGGLAFANGRAVAFFDANRDLHFCKMALHRTALMVLKEAVRRGYRRVYAVKSDKYPKADRWLARLGFEPTQDETVLVWQNS